MMTASKAVKICIPSSIHTLLFLAACCNKWKCILQTGLSNISFTQNSFQCSFFQIFQLKVTMHPANSPKCEEMMSAGPYMLVLYHVHVTCVINL